MSYQFNNQITVVEALDGLSNNSISDIFARYAGMGYERIALPALATLRKRGLYLETSEAITELLAHGDMPYGPFARLVVLELKKFRHPGGGVLKMLEALADQMSYYYDNGTQVVILAQEKALTDWVIGSRLDDLGENPIEQINDFAQQKHLGELAYYEPFTFDGECPFVFRLNGEISKS